MPGYKSLRVRVATMDDHKDICRIAKQSKYTSAYSNMIFSGEDCYAQGRIRVGIDADDKIVGFTCRRDRKRNPASVLYFIGVETEQRGKGIGHILMADLRKVSIGIVEFKVMKDNRAVGFYRSLGYKEVGEAFDGTAFVMRQEW
jgi:ribosomal protein S18 acetylase RimI-like enzyme